MTLLKGQISIDYIGGAALFFLSIMFVVTSALGSLPQFSEGVTQNQLEITAWSLTSTLLSTPGYWQRDDASGTDWEDEIVSNPDSIESIGLTGQNGLSRSKIRALDRISYDRLKAILATAIDVRMDVYEYAVVHMSEDYLKNNPPATHPPITEPTSSDQVYQDTDAPVRFGGININGKSFYFLAVARNQSYDTVYASEDWTFTADERVDPGETAVLNFNGRRFVLEPAESGVATSDGKLFMLRGVLARVGQRVPETTDEVATVRRFANIGDRIIGLDMEVWE